MYVKGLKCRECGRSYPKEPLFVCEYCFGPLEVDYDGGVTLSVTKKLIEQGKIPEDEFMVYV